MKIVDWLVGNVRGRAVTITDVPNFARTISEAIAAENKHIENRFQWNLGLQGFLFASFAIAVSKESDVALAKLFANVVAKVGMLSGLATIIGLVVAYAAINRNKMLWLGNEDQLATVCAKPFSSGWTSLLGRVPSLGITTIVLGAWVKLDQLF